VKIGSAQVDTKKFINVKRMVDLAPADYVAAKTAMRNGEIWNPAWDDQDAVHRLTFKGVTAADGPTSSTIPTELFKFELILNNSKFQVLLDQLLGLNTTEDLTKHSTEYLKNTLDNCASYKLTCYCAYDAAHRECRWHKKILQSWLVEKREEARQQIRAERIADKNYNLRKEIGQITAQDLEDWVIRKYPAEYEKYTDMVDEWEDNEKLYLEFRDTLKERAMHLQSILKMSSDNTEHTMSSGNQF